MREELKKANKFAAKKKEIAKKTAGKDSYRGSKAANVWAKFAAGSPDFNRKPIK